MSKLPTETVVFTITANHVVMERLKRFLARLERNSRVGHSAKVGLFLDGDGQDRLTVDEPALPSYESEKFRGAGGGHGYEMCAEDHYYLGREPWP